MSQIQQFKVAALSFNGNGDNTAIAASSGNPIKVWKIVFTTAGAVNVTFYNGASSGSLPLSGTLVFGGNGSMVLYYDGSPHFTTSPGNAFIVNLSGGVAIGGTVYYTLG